MAYAARALAVQVEAPALVPPFKSNVIPDLPLVTRDVRIFSMDVAFKAQAWNAPINAAAIKVPVVLNIFAGNVVRLVQLYQAVSNLVAELKLSAGNEVKLVQPRHVSVKIVPEAVLINGKEVRPVH